MVRHFPLLQIPVTQKVVKYLAVLCINAAVTGVTVSNCNKFLSYMSSVTLVVSWCQKI